jgi:hypothetical protein
MRHKRRWEELSPRIRRLIIVGASVEGARKSAALMDLARRPANEIRGSKAKWAVAIVVVNSGGALPFYYFVRARRPSDHQH